MLATLVDVGLAGSIIASAVFSAFSSTTTNPGNWFSAGTVSISDNDAGSAMYDVTNEVPGHVTTKFPSCTGFTPAAGGAIYGTLQAFASAHSSWSNGLAANNPSASATWAQNDAVAYRFEVSLQNDPLAQGASSGLHDFTWESQNL